MHPESEYSAHPGALGCATSSILWKNDGHAPLIGKARANVAPLSQICYNLCDRHKTQFHTMCSVLFIIRPRPTVDNPLPVSRPKASGSSGRDDLAHSGQVRTLSQRPHTLTQLEQPVKPCKNAC